MKQTYQWFSSAGNEPDFTRVNELAAEGWELVFFNGDVPPGGGTRQWIYVMVKGMPIERETSPA